MKPKEIINRKIESACWSLCGGDKWDGVFCADGTMWKIRTDRPMVTEIIFTKLRPLMTIKQQANEIS